MVGVFYPQARCPSAWAQPKAGYAHQVVDRLGPDEWFEFPIAIRSMHQRVFQILELVHVHLHLEVGPAGVFAHLALADCQ